MLRARWEQDGNAKNKSRKEKSGRQDARHEPAFGAGSRTLPKKYSVFVISPPHVVHHSFLSLQLLQIACSFSEYTVPILSVRETALWFLKPPFPRLQSKRVAPTSHHAHRRAKISPWFPHPPPTFPPSSYAILLVNGANVGSGTT